jgi:hypothetical protein
MVKFFKIPLILFCSFFLLYVLTLSPSVTFEDSGELITAIHNSAIAHPSGYPTYTVIGKIFTMIPSGSIAWNVNLMSAFFGALTCMMIYIVCKSIIKGKTASILAACLLGVSPYFWAESIVAEVYTLTTFLFLLLIYLSFIYYKNRNTKNLYLFFFVYGLALTNHITIITFFPVFLIFIFLKNLKTIRLKTVFICLILFLLGLIPYIYLPLRSIQNPILDWGNPENLKNFIWTISGKQYRHFMFTLNYYNFFPRIIKLITSLFIEFNIFLGFALFGLLFLYKTKKHFFFLSSGIVLINIFVNLNYGIGDIELYYFPTYIIFSIWISIGFFQFFNILKKKVKIKLFSTQEKLISLFLILLFFVISYFFFMKSIIIENKYQFRNYGTKLLDSLEGNSVVFTNDQNNYFVLLYLTQVENYRNDVVPLDIKLFSSHWYQKNIHENYPEILLKENLNFSGLINLNDLKSSVRNNSFHVYFIKNSSIENLNISKNLIKIS